MQEKEGKHMFKLAPLSAFKKFNEEVWRFSAVADAAGSQSHLRDWAGWISCKSLAQHVAHASQVGDVHAPS